MRRGSPHSEQWATVRNASRSLVTPRNRGHWRGAGAAAAAASGAAPAAPAGYVASGSRQRSEVCPV